MKWKKSFLWLNGIILTGLAGSAICGYCWLYGWSWGDLPASHYSLKPDEVRLLQKLDSYLLGEGVEHFHAEAMEMALTMHTVAGDLPEETSQWEDDPEKAFSWWERQTIRFVTDGELRRTFGQARRQLHQLVETGRAEATAAYLAMAAVHTHDIELVKLIIARGVDANGSHHSEEYSFPLICEFIHGANLKQEYMPVSKRLELLEWLVAHGLEVNGAPKDMMIPLLEVSIWFSGDDKGEILEWLLRHGLQTDSAEITGMLLRYPGTLDTLQRLIQDALLPAVPAELVTEIAAYTPLQMVAANKAPCPETVRWLISLGHGVNDMATTVIQRAEDDAAAGGREPLSPLDETLKQLVIHVDEEARTKRLEVLEILLEHGARQSEKTRDLLPCNVELKQKVAGLMEKYGIYILAGDAPCNACCSPD